MLPELERRRRATQATLDRFRGRRFAWQTGDHCLKLAHWHMKAMGRKPAPLPRVRSAIAAKRALKARGCATVTEALDQVLARIAPAQMLVGDLCAVPGDAGLDAVLVCAGPMKFMGWREDVEGVVLLDVKLGEIEAAWRV